MIPLRPQLAMELWILRPYARQFVLLVGMGLLYTFFLQTGPPVMMAMALLTGGYAFSITEANRLETLFAGLPTSRATVVVARYAVSATILLAMGLAGLLLEAARAIVRQEAWSAAGGFSVLAVCFALGSVVLGIQYPFFFKLGYNRARPVTVISIGVIAALLGGAGGLAAQGELAGLTRAIGSPAWSGAIIAGGLIVGVAALAGSTAISIRLYTRKDL